MDRRTAWRIVAGYFVVAMTWILTSDTLMHALWPQVEAHYNIGLFKGFAFVGVTSLILYALLRRIHRVEVNRFRSIFENHHAVMLLIDQDSGNLLDANPAAAAFYGWTRDQLRSMRIGDINPIGITRWREVMNHARETGQGIFQFQHRLASGELREVEVRNGPTAIGGKTAIFLIIQDITERKRAEADIQRQKNLYAALSDINHLLVHLPGSEEIFHFACRTVVERVGYRFAWVGSIEADGSLAPVARYGDDQGYIDSIQISTDQRLSIGGGPSGHAIRDGRPFVIYDFQSNPATEPWREAARRAGVHASGAFPLRRNAQTIAALNVYAQSPDYFSDDCVGLLTEIAQDISFALDNADRVQREAAAATALATAEERWRFALDGAGHGVWEWNAQTNRVNFSSQWKAMLGYDDSDIGDNLAEWQTRVHPDDLPATLREIGRHFSGESDVYVSEHRLRCRNGEYKWILDRGKIVRRDAEGRPLLVVGTHTDVTEQRLVRERLQASELRFSNVLGSLDMVAIMLDRSLRLTYCNDYLLQLTGWTREEIINRNLIEVFIPPEQQDVRNVLSEQLAHSTEAWHYQNEILTRGGERRLIRWNNVALLSADGAFSGTASIGEDITERRQMDEQLRNSEARYRDLFEANPHPMWVCDAITLRFLAVNDAAIERYGYGRDEFLGMRLSDIHPAADAQKLAEWLHQSGAAGQASVWNQLRKDGSVIEVELSAHALAFSGRDARIMHAHDMTAYQRALRALVEQEEKFRALSEQSLVGIFIIDAGRVVYVNPRAAEIFGYARQEMVGRPVFDFIDPAHQTRITNQLQRLITGEIGEAREEFSGKRKDGTAVLVGAHGMPTTIGGRRVVFGVIQDITEKMRAEETIRVYVERLERSVLGTVDAVSKMVELRDPYTAGHEQRVGELSAAIAAEMGLDENTQRGLRIAGGLHDIGKIVVPAEILSKPGRLSAVEFEMVKSHAQQGYEVLKSIEFPWPVAEVARQHHERLDGSGYPRGLKADDILLEARILAVADVVESMASHRPYRPGLGLDKALQEIERGAGTLYDAKAVAACTKLFREQRYSL